MKRSFSRAALALVLAVNAFAAACDEADPTPGDPDLTSSEIAEIEALADQVVASGIPGVVLAIQAGSQTVKVARGVEDLATSVPMTTSHHFRVGSVAKSMLASMAFQLVDEGKLRLSDTVESHLPGMVAHNSHATVEQVMRLQSGIFDHVNDPRYLAPYLNGDLGYAYTPQQLLALSNAHPAVFAPGERFMYSNTNFVIMGLIIEKLTGMPLAQAAAQRITTPLGMQQTTLPLGSGMQAPFAHGYLVGMGRPIDVTAVSASSTFGHGNVVSTPSDVNRFFAALAAGKVVKPQYLPTMFTPDPTIETRYGVGVWTWDDSPCGRWIGHEGSAAGYLSFSYARLDGRRQISVAINSLTADDKAGDQAAQKAWAALVEAIACK